jgi:hypothetical protein
MLVCVAKFGTEARECQVEGISNSLGRGEARTCKAKMPDRVIENFILTSLFELENWLLRPGSKYLI